MYVVQSNDTVSGIAAKLWGDYSRSVDLIRWNLDVIRNPSTTQLADGRFNVIVPGDRLRTEPPEPAMPIPSPVAPPAPLDAESDGGGWLKWAGLALVVIVGVKLLQGGRNGKKK